ncbi:hypothetical protein JCM11641_004972 [Rhodosporidiobolus odoratus]
MLASKRASKEPPHHIPLALGYLHVKEWADKTQAVYGNKGNAASVLLPQIFLYNHLIGLHVDRRSVKNHHNHKDTVRVTWQDCTHQSTQAVKDPDSHGPRMTIVWEALQEMILLEVVDMRYFGFDKKYAPHWGDSMDKRDEHREAHYKKIADFTWEEPQRWCNR